MKTSNLLTTFASTIQRKIPEIGVFEAMGASKNDVSLLYTLEAVILGALAASVALFLDWQASLYMSDALVDAFLQQEHLRQTTLLTLRQAPVWPLRLTLFAASIFLSGFITWITARIVLRISIAEKVRER